MKKERLFYLDFIRVVSMFMIVTYHFYAHFAENQIDGFRIFSKEIWGIVGVTLFFMISGASLMYNYDENFDLKTYFKKRFLGIYPMFWIAYTIIFCIIFYQMKCMPKGEISLLMFPLSILGMDGYLSSYFKTFYLIGEWFLGAIIILYILFPILKWFVNKNPKATFVTATVLNFAILLFCKGTKMPLYQNIITCIYRFMLGMYIIKYIKEPKVWYFVLSFIIALVLYLIPTEDYYLQVLISNVMGYSLFFVIAYVGKLINIETLKNIFMAFSKYSYAIFLVHHFIISKMENSFYGSHLRIAEVGLLYVSVWLVILASARILYMINKEALKLFEKNKKVEG